MSYNMTNNNALYIFEYFKAIFSWFSSQFETDIKSSLESTVELS